MVTVETIGRVRHAFHIKGKKIKQIARELRLARNTVRTIVRGDETKHSYERKAQPLPKLGAFADELDRLLEDNAKRPKRERLTFQRLYEELRCSGYQGGYDAVRRYGRTWERRQATKQADAYVPLCFAPGEAYQFDWSHECVVIDGVTTMAIGMRMSGSVIAGCFSSGPIRVRARRWYSTLTRRLSASSRVAAGAASTTI
jgi:hypothetical protein